MKSLTLVIPCKNEALRINKGAFYEALENIPGLSFLFVDDGSTDNTAEVLAYMSKSSLSIESIYLPRNVGKAEAVRQGVKYLLKNGSSDLIGFWDADLATPLDEVPRFVAPFEKDVSAEMVIGSRWPHLGASVIRDSFRSFSGNVMKLLIKSVLRAPIYDTQCGAKVMTRKLAGEIFEKKFVSPWMFDVELFKRMGKKRILRGVKEMPLDLWRDVEGSKMTILGAMGAIVDLLKIAFS